MCAEEESRGEITLETSFICDGWDKTYKGDMTRTFPQELFTRRFSRHFGLLRCNSYYQEMFLCLPVQRNGEEPRMHRGYSCALLAITTAGFKY